MISLAGTWNYKVGGGLSGTPACTITQRGDSKLFYLTGHGNNATGPGTFTSATEIAVSFPFDELTGDIGDGGNTISWSNGQVYARA